MNFIKDIYHFYDDYHDQLYIVWTDLSMMCCYIKPIPREVDIPNLVESILNGEQNW